jgi:hypothetical protein
MKKGGKVFALETDKAFKAISADSDWAFYIQGDEIVHEKYLGTIHSAMIKWRENIKVDGLVFNYLHFYGSYDYVGTSPQWYRNEIRVIRNDKSIYSYRDAQGFRKGENKKLNVKPVDAFVYHYGWVKEPEIMMKKVKNNLSFYEDVDSKQILNSGPVWDYSSIDALNLFRDSHPAVMKERIMSKNWSFEHDISFNKLSLKYKGKIFLKNYMGVNTFYENFRVI